MPRYVDGFVLPLKKKNLAAYRSLSRKAGKIWKKHGALEYIECVGDDFSMKGVASFPKLARTRRGEVVLFSFIVYKSRRHRDQVNKKVMADPLIGKMCDPEDMPFDVGRMAYGGFRAFVDL
jgi:uncharacterized protein YbaA (DUF1428 family)